MNELTGILDPSTPSPKPTSDVESVHLARRRHSFSIAFALIVVLIAFFPALAESSRNAGLLYSGDITGFYAPTILKTNSLIQNLQFTALDFSIYNGSSDFFLSPNFFTFHPAVIAFATLVPEAKATVHTAGKLIVLMLAAHAFLAMYFTQRLLMRHFMLGFWPAFFGAVLFAFSIQLQSAVTQPPFFFIVTVFPWICCALIEFQSRPGLAASVTSSVPVVLALVGGYIPLGLAAIALAFVVASLYKLSQPTWSATARARQLSLTLLPVFAGIAVCSAYILSMYLFNRETGSRDAISVFYSAHQLSDSPASILRAFSTYIAVPGTFYEFSVSIGAVSVAIITIFIFSPSTWASLSKFERAALKSSVLIYLLVLLSIFGPSSVLSDMIYYFVPQIGKMHIYQRFLLFAQLALAISVTIMLLGIHRARPQTTIRIVLGGLIALIVTASTLFAYHPTLLPSYGVQQIVLFEFLCAATVVCFLLSSSLVTIFLVATGMAALPVVDRYYDLTQYGNTFESQRSRLPFYLQPELRADITDFLDAQSEKPFIKYVDLTPMWTPQGVETFPKVFPYLVLNDELISSYTGFTFYLSSRLEYRQRMPIENDVRLSPDWNFVRQSGADFAIISAADFASGALGVAGAELPELKILRLPNDLVLAALPQFRSAGTLFDNGVFRVSTLTPTAFASSNLALNATVRHSQAEPGGSRAVDGITNGDFAQGSVMHSVSDPNAWLEIDLGRSVDIGAIRVWNRTDCCKDRLDNFWLFVSDIPLEGNLTAEQLRQRTDVWAQQGKAPAKESTIETGGIRGRYVRLQLPGTSAADSAFLHIAELEIFEKIAGLPAQQEAVSLSDVKFEMNFANRVEVEFEASGPIKIEYQFSHNPRLAYLVNGKQIKFDTTSGVPTYVLPAGKHQIEIRYNHWLLSIFWWVYGTFWVAVVLISMAPYLRPLSERFRSRRRRTR